MKFEVYRTKQRQDEPERHCVVHSFPKVQGSSCNPGSGKLVTVAAFSTQFKMGTFVPPSKATCTCHLMQVPESTAGPDGMFF